MKRKVTLCVLVFALLLTCANAMAAKIGSATAESGSGATVSDKDEDGNSFSGKAFTVTYDGQKDKEYVVMVVASDVGTPTATNINNNQGGVVVYMDQIKCTESNEKVTFTVRPNLANATAGQEYSVYVSSNETSGNTMKKVASFTIGEILALIGDVNGDEKVNSSDITALVNLIISGQELTENQKKAADTNEDDKVNSSDITALVNLVIQG